MSELHYEVLVNDGLRRHREQTLPDGSPIISSPLASTLIYGERDAVLVDPPFTHEQVQPRRRLDRTLRQTPDRRLRNPRPRRSLVRHRPLLKRFPDAIAYATEGTIALMHQQGSEGRAQLWDSTSRPIPPSPVVYNPFRSRVKLEGHKLVAVEVGHTDTDDTTVLHVPRSVWSSPATPSTTAYTRCLLETPRWGRKRG